MEESFGERKLEIVLLFVMIVFNYWLVGRRYCLDDIEFKERESVNFLYYFK